MNPICTACGFATLPEHNVGGICYACLENRGACPKCGHVIAIGEFPFCKGSASDHGAWLTAEEPLTPYFDEHVSPEGREFRTRGERRAFMRENNLEYHDVSKKRRGARLYLDMGRK